MSDEWQAYVQDPRSICKYGEKCYQQNPDHHNKYKHPPSNQKHKVDTNKGANKRFSPYTRETTKADSGEDTPRNPMKHGKRFKVSEDETSGTRPDKSDLNKTEEPTQCENETKLCSVDDSFTDIINQIPKDLTYHESTIEQSKFKELFLVEMPDCFFKFFECLKEENDMEKLLSSVNLQLIGPFELLLGKLPVLDNKDLYLLHWRFFYDPPEFQAVLKSKDKSEFHIGYFRDDPSAKPVFLAHNDSSKGCHITPYASNIFGAVYLYLEHQKKSPFTAMTYKKTMDKVKSWAEKHNYSIEEYNAKRRTNLSIAKTLHGAGIMVPYDKKTQLGYRRLVESDANLKKLFSKLAEAKSQTEKDKILSELQPVITYANIAVDECDFGTGLEVGIDMFCSGLKELEASAMNSLCSVYSLLNRAEFGTIIQAHLKCRRKGPDMSILSISKI
ncbi:histone PARylation factor 1 [Leguminivora glycinivorella]|uniref:histone PARylation factor 1 n=1 Tax=Leguminivora glycinivorella TaxID=1035111 RepID=UPI00200F7066|nr:histone PARylation factor 1 [Leguminivora glycinivorella]